MASFQSSPLLPELQGAFAEIFGSDSDPIESVAMRAATLLAGRDVVVWEGDPATFEFTYVSPSAEKVFGHPRAAWMTSGFWTDAVLHDEDRADAIAYCALATGQGKDHQFEYRARHPDGGVRWIYDVVKVVKGPRGLPERLRGVMLDISELKRSAGEHEARAERRYPALAEAS